MIAKTRNQAPQDVCADSLEHAHKPCESVTHQIRGRADMINAAERIINQISASEPELRPNTYAGLRAQSQRHADEMRRLVHERLVPRLVDALDARAIWLFGSVARGEPTSDSDCDILVISGAAVDGLTWKERWNLGYDAILDAALPFHCDLVVWSEVEFSEKQRQNSHFYRAIDSQKKVVYERQ